MDNPCYTLKEIASWATEDKEVQIPALQRGLVWKPRQVELLWDSILRGFPIGSFMLSDVVAPKRNEVFYLMDGQQRYNAISVGFNAIAEPRAVLWIDLEPPTIKNSTRIFWIKATTTPHPWGYKNDDEAQPLNTWEKREALKAFKLKGNIYNDYFSLTQTWPIEANLPIPLYCLLRAIEIANDADSFVQKTIDYFEASEFEYKKEFRLTDKAREYLHDTLYPSFKALEHYRIHCNRLPVQVMEGETEGDPADQTTLEVLFTRLNTQGTPISRDDLNYSAIKAYWSSIKDVNDALAEKYMSPAKLVMLAFRLALTSDKDDSLKGELSIKQIRSAARKPEDKAKIEHLYENGRLERILDKVDEWLGVKETSDRRTPAILRTIIGRQTPEVYLLLMYFARINEEAPNKEALIDLQPSEIRALAFLIHWFGNDKKKCVQEIYKRCRAGINRQNIQKGIARLFHDCQLLHVYTPEEVGDFMTIGESGRWRLWHSLPAPASNFFNRTFWYNHAEPKQMLLYAEREYINTHFRNYDPARQDMWAEENRPWDFDHIVPQEWITRKRNADYREYDKDWLWSIGNIAAIPFEVNRSKSNSNDFAEYLGNEDTLLYSREFESVTEDVARNQSQSVTFAKVTFQRYCRIYAAAYEIIEPMIAETILSDTLQKRKDLILKIKERLPEEAFAHFAAGDDNDHKIEREQDWAREWIGIGIERGEYMVCYEWAGYMEGGKPKYAEIGIRKARGTKVTREKLHKIIGEKADYEELNDWWYKAEFNYEVLDAETIAERIKQKLEELDKMNL